MYLQYAEMVREVTYRWRYYDSARRKWCITRHQCTEESIRKEYPDATRIESTRREIELLTDDERYKLMANSGMFYEKKRS